MQANILMSHLVPLFRAAANAGYDYTFSLVHSSMIDGVAVYEIGDHHVSQMSLALNKVWVNAPDFGYHASSSDNPYRVIDDLVAKFDWLVQFNTSPKIHPDRPVIALFHTRDIGVIRVDTPIWKKQ